LLLLKNGVVFSPAHLGTFDLLIAGERIVHIGPELVIPKMYLQDSIDLQGKWILPGLIDAHVHIAGAGGEGGPGTRTEGVGVDRLVKAGITSVVGCLGTDGVTRAVESVLMKAKALKAKGLSAWIFTGSYQIPSPTITGQIARDIALIEEVIGTGEIALADHRSSMPTLHEFVSLLQQSRLGGMLGGKSGLVNIHIGDHGSPFALLEEALAVPGIHPDQMLPTHCNRSRGVFDDAVRFARHGFVDLTCSAYPYFPDIEIKPSRAWEELLATGIGPERITLSSDAGGSLPRFDPEGHFVGMDEGEPDSVLREVRDMIAAHENDFSRIEMALAAVTRNVANRLRLERRGEIREGYRSDLLVLDQNMNVFLTLAGETVMYRQ
jgi:beta-aspartyl-dipeptidase (metallo-type)